MSKYVHDRIAEKDKIVGEYISISEELIDLKKEYESKKNKLYLSTDFKELGLTNEKMRNAFVDEECLDMKTEIEMKKVELDALRMAINLADDWIEYGILYDQGE